MDATPVNRICPACGNTFESLRHYNKVYCNVKCRRKEKIRRSVVRADGGNPTLPEQQQEQIATTLIFPDDAKLNFWADVIKRYPEDHFVKIVGMNHMWEGDGVKLIKQPLQEKGADVWLMVKHQPSALDVLLAK